VTPVDKPPLGDRDAILLKALREQYPTGHFDECNIAIDAPGSPDLLGALAFLDVKVDARRRALGPRSHEVVVGWLDRVEGLPVDGLLLKKDPIGWCRVQGVTGATGCAE
jgi:hypothetical protein